MIVLSYKNAGFTIIEILIASAIIVILSAIMFFNFQSSGSNITARNQTVGAIVADIRRVQTMSINSSTIGGVTVCGYGVHYIASANNNNYIIYARQKPVGGSCTFAGNRNYGQGAAGYTDAPVQSIFLANSNFGIKTGTCPNNLQGISFTGNNNDIFFEPPDPKTYLNNKLILDASVKDILITVDLQAINDCSGKYSTIIIHPSGAIDVQ